MKLLLWISIQLLLTPPDAVWGFVPLHHHQHGKNVNSVNSVNDNNNKLAAKKQTTLLEEEEAPAGIVGAAFFGGNKEKEEFFDPVAEDKAAVDASLSTSNQVDSDDGNNRSKGWNRFFADDSEIAPSVAFDSLETAQLAASLQSQINDALYEGADKPNLDYSYAASNKFQWITALKTGDNKATTPMAALEEALSFYQHVDVAMVSGTRLPSGAFQIGWEISVVWPTFWEPRVLLLGTSMIQLEGDAGGSSKTIISQTDQLIDQNSGAEVLGAVSSQVKPRFWDWYHIGMTPSAEVMPKLNFKKGLTGGYQVYETPARWVVSPTVLDVGGRDDSNAQTVPNHAFTCIIKTMGPARQRYVPTTPVEVQLIPGGDGGLKLKWSIPLSVELQTKTQLPLPGEDSEAVAGSNPECTYDFQPRRKVATVAYAGNPQDKEITDIRKKLYERVLKEGLTPKLDTGRPIFFFLQNAVKACYTEEGLGMCVYEWQPKFAKPNEVGIELEPNDDGIVKT